MCVILDANTWHSVFIESSNDHHDFLPLHDWIFNGKGRIVYGGTRYKNELSRARKYIGLFVELRKIRKIIEVCDNEVDQKQVELEDSIQNAGFDDAHIIAIVIISG